MKSHHGGSFKCLSPLIKPGSNSRTFVIFICPLHPSARSVVVVTFEITTNIHKTDGREVIGLIILFRRFKKRFHSSMDPC